MRVDGDESRDERRSQDIVVFSLGCPMLRVLLVDGDGLSLHAMERLLQGRYATASAASAVEAIEIALGETLDVVVADAATPGLTGTDLLLWFRKKRPGCGRVLLTGHPDVSSLMDANNLSEADRVLRKPATETELHDAIDIAATKGQDRAFLQTARSHFQPSGETKSSNPTQGFSINEWRNMSTREREIVTLRCRGLSPRVIANRLSIEVSTVQTHLKNVRERFGLESVEALIAKGQGLDGGQKTPITEDPTPVPRRS
jgi:DNA-binding NarL/FixJ family response regulator